MDLNQRSNQIHTKQQKIQSQLNAIHAKYTNFTDYFSVKIELWLKTVLHLNFFFLTVEKQSYSYFGVYLMINCIFLGGNTFIQILKPGL